MQEKNKIRWKKSTLLWSIFINPSTLCKELQYVIWYELNFIILMMDE